MPAKEIQVLPDVPQARCQREGGVRGGKQIPKGKAMAKILRQ